MTLLKIFMDTHENIYKHYYASIVEEIMPKDEKGIDENTYLQCTTDVSEANICLLLIKGTRTSPQIIFGGDGLFDKYRQAYEQTPEKWHFAYVVEEIKAKQRNSVVCLESFQPLLKDQIIVEDKYVGSPLLQIRSIVYGLANRILPQTGLTSNYFIYGLWVVLK